MKLLKCHIENFGKLTNQDYNFEAKINQYIYPNGSGKTTLADFIFAMFYGLKSTKQNNKDFLERKRYYPFNNGLFGGNITFEYNGDIYKIERFFDKTSETKDTCTIYKNDNILEMPNTTPGDTFFKLNADSYNKLLSISTKEITLETSSDINKQLNNDLYQLEKSFDLKQIVTRLNTNRYKKAELDTLKARQKTLENELNNYLEIEKQRDDKYENLSTISSDISKLEEKYAKAIDSNKLAMQYKNLEDLETEIKTKEDEVNSLYSKYQNGLPENLTDISSLLEQKQQFEIEINSNKLSESEENRYNYLSSKLVSIPTDSEIKEIEKQIANLENNKNREQYILDSFSNKSLQFLNREVSKELLEKLNDLENRYNQNEAIYQNMADFNFVSTKKQINKKPYMIWLILSILLLALGGIFFLVNNIVAIITLVVGGVNLLADGFSYLNAMIKAQNPEPNINNMEKNAFRAEILQPIINEITNILSPYGYNDQNILININNFKRDYEDYLKSKANDEEAKQAIASLHEDNQNITTSLDILFNKYQIKGHQYKEMIDYLKDEIKELNLLKNKINDIKYLNANKESELTLINNKLKDINNKYNLEIDKNSLENIKNDSLMINAINEQLKSLKQKHQDYKERNNLDGNNVIEEIDVEELSANLNDLRQKKVSLEQTISDIEEADKAIDNIEDELHELKEKISNMNHKNQIIEKTISMLEQTNEDLSQKMIGPVKERFINYAKILEDILGKEIAMDKNYQIQFEKNGAYRAIGHLSSGELTLTALCYRLAMLNEMFSDELPFVILDDPFAFLDEEAFKKASELLKQISNYQILYFTCHESRKLN